MEAPNRATVMDAFSEALTRCEEVWRDVGLPDEDREQRRQSYFSALLNEVSEFRQSQEMYRETVERQIVELTRQLRVTAAALEEEDALEVPQRETKYDTMKAISALQEGLGKELERRAALAAEFSAKIADAAEALGEEVPEPIAALISQQTYPRQALEAMEAAVADYSARARPLAESCVEEARVIADICSRFGRDARTEFASVQPLLMSLAQPPQPKPKYLPELRRLRAELERALEARTQEVSSLRAKVTELQLFLAEVENEIQGEEGADRAAADRVSGGGDAHGATGAAVATAATTAAGAAGTATTESTLIQGSAVEAYPSLQATVQNLKALGATEVQGAQGARASSSASASSGSPTAAPSPALAASTSLYLSALVESSVSRDTIRILLDSPGDVSDATCEGLRAELDRLERRRAKRLPVICQKLQKDIHAIRRSMLPGGSRDALPLSLECSEDYMNSLLRERKQLQELKAAFDHVFRVIAEYDHLAGLFHELIGVMTDPRRFSGKGREVSHLVQREDSLKRKVNLRLPYKMAEVLQLYRNLSKVLAPETRAALEGAPGGQPLDVFGGRNFEAEVAAICKEDMAHGTRAIEKRLALCMKDPRSRQLLNEVAAGKPPTGERPAVAPGAAGPAAPVGPAGPAGAQNPRPGTATPGRGKAQRPAATPHPPDRPRTAGSLLNSHHGVTFASTPGAATIAYARTPADAVLASRVESVRRLREARTPSRTPRPRGQARVDDQLSASTFREDMGAGSRGPARTRIPVLSTSVLNKTPDVRAKERAAGRANERAGEHAGQRGGQRGGQGIAARLSAGPERVAMK